jgi:hypothetical protein
MLFCTSSLGCRSTAGQEYAMTRSYRAVISDDHIEWTNGAPERKEKLHVTVTVADEDQLDDSERGARMAEALVELARIGAFSEIEDSAAWEREIRRDRPLSAG